MQDFLDLILSNKVYMLAAGGLVLFLIIFLLKKLFKLAMFIIILALAYGGYVYMTEDDPKKAIQDKLNQGKSAVRDIDGATSDLRKESIDKVIDEVDKQIKEAAKKRK